MKLHFLNENSLEALRVNLRENLENYKNPTNDWIYKFFDGSDPFLEYKIEVMDFALTFDAERPIGEQDVDNAIILYSAMKNLSDTQAADERLWAGLCHCDQWEYLHIRMKKNNEKTLKENEIKTRYFFAHDRKRSLLTNSLSRLWWLGRLTYDKNRSDPFELTKYFKENFSHKFLTTFSRNYTGNIEIIKGLISALIELDQETDSDNIDFEAIHWEATRYLNVLGGMYILDYFTSDEIHDRVIKHIKPKLAQFT